MSVAQVIQKSSNVGAAKIALVAAARGDARHVQARRLRRRAAARLSGRGRRPGARGEDLAPVEQATMAYGHGISVSLIQLARAYTVFARDGELAPLSLRQDRRAPARGRARVLAGGRARGARDAGSRGAARRHRAARAHRGLARRRQDRHRAQAGERRLRGAQVRVLVRRLRAGVRSAPGDRGDAGRALGRPVLRRRRWRHPCSRRSCRARCACWACPTTRRSRRSSCPARATRRRRTPD